MRLLKLFEDFNNNQFKQIEDFENYLHKFSIPFQYWGTGKSKTTEDLLKEIENKDCILREEDGLLVRYIEFVGVEIFYKDKQNNIYRLKEDRQVFKDGRVRKRNLPVSVAEKMQSGEDPLLSAVRGIKEELQIEIEKSQLEKSDDIDFKGGSLSYPGLRTEYTGHKFKCELKEHQFVPGGYVENQSTKSTYFVWQKL
jgi:hypothetical protein